MTEQSEIPQTTELVYPPKASWVPMFVAVGVLALVVATFKGRPYAIVGAVVLLIALSAWLKSTFYDVGRLPRRQRTTTAVIPAEPLRRPEADS